MPALSLDEVRWQLKDDLDQSISDMALQRLIDSAQDYVEKKTGLVLSLRQVTQPFSGTEPLLLNAWPIATDATITATYLDIAGDEQPLAGVRLVAYSRPARVVFPTSAKLPTMMRAPDAIRITVDAGYPDSNVVPGSIKQAMLMLIGHFDRNREAVVASGASKAPKLPLGVEDMLSNYLAMVA